jgi:hypothetical protein
MLLKVLEELASFKLQRVIDTSDIYRPMPDIQIYFYCKINEEMKIGIIAYPASEISNKLHITYAGHRVEIENRFEYEDYGDYNIVEL